MGLEELKKYYNGLEPSEVKKNLELGLAFTKLTGKLEVRDVIMIKVAEERGILNKSEIDNYKINYFDAIMQDYK